MIKLKKKLAIILELFKLLIIYSFYFSIAINFLLIKNVKLYSIIFVKLLLNFYFKTKIDLTFK